MDCKDLSSMIKRKWDSGRRRAGFPTYMKIDERAQIILLNCAECEPLLKLHRQLLEKVCAGNTGNIPAGGGYRGSGTGHRRNQRRI